MEHVKFVAPGPVFFNVSCGFDGIAVQIRGRRS